MSFTKSFRTSPSWQYMLANEHMRTPSRYARTKFFPAESKKRLNNREGVQSFWCSCGEFEAGKLNHRDFMCCFARRNRATMFRPPSRCAQRNRWEQKHKKERIPQRYSFFFGAPAENRTPDTLIKSALPAELQGQMNISL